MGRSKLICVVLSVLLLLTGCSQNRGKATLNPNNSNTVRDEIVQQLESEHFKFYSKEQDKECLKDLSNALEDNYARVTNNLNASLDKKVSVYIYSDLSTFHKAIYQPDAPSWVVGIALPTSNTIKMVHPSNADGRPYSDFMKIIVHEFTHVVVSNISSEPEDIPIWLNEGVALFEAEQHEGVEETLSKASNKFPSLKDLETDSSTFGYNGGYQFSYSIAEYIVKIYGYDKLIALIKLPSEFEKILGLSEEDFQKEWITYCN